MQNHTNLEYSGSLQSRGMVQYLQGGGNHPMHQLTILSDHPRILLGASDRCKLSSNNTLCL